MKTTISHFLKKIWILIQLKILGYWKHKNYQRKKNEAIVLCIGTKKKYYVVRSSPVNYVILSSDDVKSNKAKKIFKKNLNFLDMWEVSSAIVWPGRFGVSYVLVKDDKDK